MRQKRKQWKLLIGIGICLMLAGAVACDKTQETIFRRQEDHIEVQKEEEGFCLPGSFVFDMIYPFRLGTRILRFYFYSCGR